MIVYKIQSRETKITHKYSYIGVKKVYGWFLPHSQFSVLTSNETVIETLWGRECMSDVSYGQIFYYGDSGSQ